MGESIEHIDYCNDDIVSAMGVKVNTGKMLKIGNKKYTIYAVFYGVMASHYIIKKQRKVWLKSIINGFMWVSNKVGDTEWNNIGTLTNKP